MMYLHKLMLTLQFQNIVYIYNGFIGERRMFYIDCELFVNINNNLHA